MRAVIFGVAVALGSSVAQAQPDTPETPPPPPEQQIPAKKIIIVGKVIDALGRPVRGATVTIEGSPDIKPTKTDKFGAFRVDGVPIGSTIVVDKGGYQTALGTANAAQLDDIVMLTEDQYSETIELKGEAPAVTPGAAKLDRTELQRIPGTGGDIVKSLTAMPGVVNLQIPLGYSGVVIRGSSPQDSKVLVDDFEIPVLFHNIGFRALIPAESINSLDYIPGGYDVAYGRASSGIVALTTRAGSDERSTQAEVSVIDGGVLAQGPAGKNTKYMLGFRRSTIDFVLPSIIPDDVDLSLTTVPSYYDAQFRIDHKLNNKWRLAFSGIGTDDRFELYATKDDDAKSKRFFNRTRFLRLTAAAKYSDGPWNANLALSGILPEFVFEAGEFQYINVTNPSITPRAEITRSTPEAIGLKDVVWRVGAEAQIVRQKLDLALPVEPREGEVQQMYDPKDISQRFTNVTYQPDFAAWTAGTASFDPRFRITLGVRAEFFERVKDFLLQPRMEAKFKINKPWSLRLSTGYFSRPPEFQSESVYDVKGERSRQVIGGAQYEPNDALRVQASVYYTDRTKLITHSADGMATGDLVNEGHGTTKGAELLATYRKGPWFGWLSYSFSKSTRIDHPGDPERPFTFDQPHSMNAAVSWKKGKWQLGGRFQLYSGLPYTPILGSVFDNTRNIYVPIPGEPNSERAPMHHQLDLRVDRTWKIGGLDLTGFIDVQNVYMNDSVVTYFYSYDYTQKAAFKSLPLIPSLGLRGVF